MCSMDFHEFHVPVYRIHIDTDILYLDKEDLDIGC